MNNKLSGGSNMSNERIRELSKQAGQGDMFSVPPKFIDLFAKLIIAECAEVSKSGDPLQDGGIARMIKEHFGVK